MENFGVSRIYVKHEQNILATGSGKNDCIQRLSLPPTLLSLGSNTTCIDHGRVTEHITAFIAIKNAFQPPVEARSFTRVRAFGHSQRDCLGERRDGDGGLQGRCPCFCVCSRTVVFVVEVKDVFELVTTRKVRVSNGNDNGFFPLTRYHGCSSWVCEICPCPQSCRSLVLWFLSRPL